jgi:hypothetical protein
MTTGCAETSRNKHLRWIKAHTAFSAEMPHATRTGDSHSAQGIRERLARGPRGNYLRDWIYGGIDGTVTTFAIVAGVVGAS